MDIFGINSSHSLPSTGNPPVAFYEIESSLSLEDLRRSSCRAFCRSYLPHSPSNCNPPLNTPHHNIRTIAMRTTYVKDSLTRTDIALRIALEIGLWQVRRMRKASTVRQPAGTAQSSRPWKTTGPTLPNEPNGDSGTGAMNLRAAVAKREMRLCIGYFGSK
ncbi:hypothetical protein BT63DRAFT_454234 [Microthyrium microscopicum]|uniref:Uncharacterized protein n=1 Tax=Microthyrium microscopicum TaxID=703497 RepID=A0A6A6UF35_9PEZI|nr:hypothetical protein BT63DRAFT_454234 [Microthyrium microscopicum]